MAHQEQFDFVNKVKDNFKFYFKCKHVLEVGSLYINGSIRDFFEECSYIGIDVAEGPGVDVVCQGQDYVTSPNTFDVSCSAECFEHNPFWLKTFKNMILLTKPGGLIFFTCATVGRQEHGIRRTSPSDSPLTVNLGWDYYQNLTAEDFINQMKLNDFFSYYGFETNNVTYDLYFYGIVR